jgi:peptidoglycan/LPS O-acetylase OafA/YrhL
VTASASLDGGPAARTEHAFPCLDGARALAATAVVGTHVAFWTGLGPSTLLGRAFARMDVGVPIFFVLSGFLLSRPLFLAAAEGRAAPRPAAYLWRRALRILPAYWLTISVALLFLPGNRDAGVADLLRHLLLVQNYTAGPMGEGLTHTWSLSTEVSFYLVLPLLGAGLTRLSGPRPDRPTRILAALGGATLLGLGWLVWVWWDRPISAPMDLWLPSFAGWFGAGMAFAVLSVSDPAWRPVRVVRELGASLPTCWAAAGVLFWFSTTSFAGPLDLSVPSPGQAVTKNVLYLGVAAFLVLPLVFGNQRAGLTRRALGGPLVTSLGEISYGLFLVHVPVIVAGYALLGQLPFTGNFLLVLITTWLISVGIATAVYAAVERPARRWRGLVPDRPRRTASASTEATTAETATSTRI